jgi:hypothetical protein
VHTIKLGYPAMSEPRQHVNVATRYDPLSSHSSPQNPT